MQLAPIDKYYHQPRYAWAIVNQRGVSRDGTQFQFQVDCITNTDRYPQCFVVAVAIDGMDDLVELTHGQLDLFHVVLDETCSEPQYIAFNDGSGVLCAVVERMGESQMGFEFHPG